MLNVGHFYTLFTLFSVGLYLRTTFFMVYQKIVVFQLSHNTTPNQGKLRRFSSSVRRPEKAGEVRDDMSTSLILRSSNLQFKLTVLSAASLQTETDSYW